MKGPYQVIVLDQDDCELGHTEENTLREATRSANEKRLSGEYGDWHRIEVRSADGTVEKDYIRPSCRVCGEWLGPNEEHGEEPCASDDSPEPGEMRETGP